MLVSISSENVKELKDPLTSGAGVACSDPPENKQKIFTMDAKLNPVGRSGSWRCWESGQTWTVTERCDSAVLKRFLVDPSLNQHQHQPGTRTWLALVWLSKFKDLFQEKAPVPNQPSNCLLGGNGVSVIKVVADFYQITQNLIDKLFQL